MPARKTTSARATARKTTTRKKPQRKNKPGVETFGSRVIMARQRLGMTQDELAALIHKNVRSVQAYESDEWDPRDRQARAIAEVLNVPIQWLKDGEDAQPLLGERVEVERLLNELNEKMDTILAKLNAASPKAPRRRS